MQAALPLRIPLVSTIIGSSRISTGFRPHPRSSNSLQKVWSLPPPLGSAGSGPSGPGGEKFEADNRRYAELTSAIEAAAAAAQEGLQGTSMYLVGMMGSGKSTVGKLISQALGYCFFDTDALIEQLAGKTIPEIFAEDGEEEFRGIETQVLQELAPFKNCIISTGGGAATRSENWGHMQGGISVWLNGSPALLARRVLQDGTDNRPLLSSSSSSEQPQQEDKGSKNGSKSTSTAKEEAQQVTEEYHRTVERLIVLLHDREEQYSFADITVSLEGDDPETADFGAPAAVVALRVLQSVNERIARDSALREQRKNFEVVNENLPPSMRVVQSINTPADSGGAGGKENEKDPYLP